MDDLKKKQNNTSASPGLIAKQDVIAAVNQMDGWCYISDGAHLFKRFDFNNYAQTMAFVNLIAWLARRNNHHPDCHFGYNYCEVCLTTHDAGGVTANDLTFAQALERLID